MRTLCAVVLILSCAGPVGLAADMLSNPGFQVGEKNLFVGLEYSTLMHEYELDTGGLETSSDRVSLKFTVGLRDWLDVFVKGGGANLMLDYVKESNALKNYDSEFGAGFGAGARLRVMNFEDSRTRVFLQGGGFFFKTDNNIEWEVDALTSLKKEREIEWADMYVGLGIAKQMDFVDFTIGAGFSQIYWNMQDVDVRTIGSAVTRTNLPERNSFESLNPVYGFIGLDFILPLEYRISAQAGIRNMDEAEFCISISQGLERD